MGCDGSVYLANEVAACAWMVAEASDKAMTACFLLTNISSISSYCSKLEGIYCSLVHVDQLDITPMELHQWCDNESAVNDSNKPLTTPGAMIKPDADILLAICDSPPTHPYGFIIYNLMLACVWTSRLPVMLNPNRLRRS